MNSLMSVVVLLGAIAAASAGFYDTTALIAGRSDVVVRSGLHHTLTTPIARTVPFGLAAPLAYHSGLIVPRGHGLEGQWIPDINDKFYDDGSYKPYIYGF